MRALQAVVVQVLVSVVAGLFLASIWTNSESLASHLASTGAVLMIWPLAALFAEFARRDLCR